MSDSFIAIFGTGILTGATLTLLILLLAGGKNDRQTYIDTDMRIYVPSRNRGRGGTKPDNKSTNNTEGR